MKIGFLILAAILVAQFVVAEDSGRQNLNMPDHNDKLPFTDGVLVGDTLYLSGRLGLDPKTGKPPESPEAEAKLILDGMKAVLEKAGMTMDHLVQVQVYCPDLKLYDTFNGVYRTYFTKGFPARAFIGSGPLLREARFEVIGIAVKK